MRSTMLQLEPSRNVTTPHATAVETGGIHRESKLHTPRHGPRPAWKHGCTPHTHKTLPLHVTDPRRIITWKKGVCTRTQPLYSSSARHPRLLARAGDNTAAGSTGTKVSPPRCPLSLDEAGRREVWCATSATAAGVYAMQQPSPYLRYT